VRSGTLIFAFGLPFNVQSLQRTPLKMILFSFVFALPMQLALWLHPMHVSVTEIEMNDKAKRLEIMMRVFIDDLEVTLRRNFKQPELDVLEPKGQSLDDMMKSYLKARFQVTLDGKPQIVSYIGHERDHEAFVFYIEVEKVKKWKSIQVQNSIITEIYDDQSNLVHVTVAETVRSLRLTRAKPADMITFELK
jgi:hypothetical protein